jgi:hypothetical protein
MHRASPIVATDPRSAAEEADIKKRDDERVFEGDFRLRMRGSSI